MELITTLSPGEPIAITIGNFDGIHRGHQRLMHELRALAEALGCKPVMITFSPHTLMVVKPDIYVQYLTTLEEKIALAREYGGIADYIVVRFTREVASMSAGEFIDSLRERFTIKGMVVGEDFSFGHNRQGNVSFLEGYAREHGLMLRAISLEEAGQTRISSTRIRSLVAEGQIAEANALLGHPVLVSGKVIRGNERGRLIGFPTANLRLDPHKLLPANGVYAVRVHVQNEQNGEGSDSFGNPTVYNGVVNIGVRPTFNEKERLVEAHLLDVDIDLYDKEISIELLVRLRDEQRFSGIDALKAQISSDVQRARQILATGG
jgi:riboflavin kinase/FMN adenylyltransferase